MNDTVTWTQVAISYPEAAKAFHGVPKRVLLQPGESIYRIYSDHDPDRKPGVDPRLGTWWITEKVWNTLTQCAANSTSNISDWARSRLAIKLNWSPEMDRAVRATITSFTPPQGKPGIWGFSGAPQYQRFFDPDRRRLPGSQLIRSNVVLMGDRHRTDGTLRFEQLFIPDLYKSPQYIRLDAIPIRRGSMRAGVMPPT